MVMAGLSGAMTRLPLKTLKPNPAQPSSMALTLEVGLLGFLDRITNFSDDLDV